MTLSRTHSTSQGRRAPRPDRLTGGDRRAPATASATPRSRSRADSTGRDRGLQRRVWHALAVPRLAPGRPLERLVGLAAPVYAAHLHVAAASRGALGRHLSAISPSRSQPALAASMRDAEHAGSQ